MTRGTYTVQTSDKVVLMVSRDGCMTTKQRNILSKAGFQFDRETGWQITTYRAKATPLKAELRRMSDDWTVSLRKIR